MRGEIYCLHILELSAKARSVLGSHGLELSDLMRRDGAVRLARALGCTQERAFDELAQEIQQKLSHVGVVALTRKHMQALAQPSDVRIVLSNTLQCDPSNTIRTLFDTAKLVESLGNVDPGSELLDEPEPDKAYAFLVRAASASYIENQGLATESLELLSLLLSNDNELRCCGFDIFLHSLVADSFVELPSHPNRIHAGLVVGDFHRVGDLAVTGRVNCPGCFQLLPMRAGDAFLAEPLAAEHLMESIAKPLILQRSLGERVGSARRYPRTDRRLALRLAGQESSGEYPLPGRQSSR